MIVKQLDIFEQQLQVKIKAYREHFYRGVKERYAKEKRDRETKNNEMIYINLKTRNYE